MKQIFHELRRIFLEVSKLQVVIIKSKKEKIRMDRMELECYLQKVEKEIETYLAKTGLCGFNINLLTKSISRDMPNVQSLHVDKNNVYIRKPTPEYIILSFLKELPGKEIPCSSFYRHITHEEAIDFIIVWNDWIESCLQSFVNSGMTAKEKQVKNILMSQL